MKKAICLILVLVMALSLCACGGSGTSTAAATTAQPAATQNTSTNASDAPAAITAEANSSVEYPTLKLTVSDYNVANSGPGQATQMACDYITQASGGKITFDVYLGGTLMEASDSFSGTASGLADITYYMCGLTSGVQTAGEMFTQVFYRPMPQIDGLTEIIRDSYDQIPELQKELESQGLHALTEFSAPVAYMAFSDDTAMSVKSPADLKGKIIQASSAYLIDAYQQNGISGLAMGPADWYSNFERGVCDALVLNLPCYNDFGLLELIKSYLWCGEYGGYASGCSDYLVNLDTWNSLDDNVKALITEGFTKAADWCVARDYATEKKVAATEFTTKDVQVLSDDEMKPFYDISLQSYDLWKKDVDAKGYDADTIFKTYDSIIEKYMSTYTPAADAPKAPTT